MARAALLAVLLLGSWGAAAGPIVVTLTGALGEDSPYGPAGSEYSFAFELDDATPAFSTSAGGNTANYQNAVTAIRFLSMNTSITGAPTNAEPDSNFIIVSDDIGQPGVFKEDLVQSFFDMPAQSGFADLFFGFLLLDRHSDGEPVPNSVPSLGLDVFSLLDAADFARDATEPLIANNQFVFRGSFNGVGFSDFTSTITSISAAPGSIDVPEPGMAGLLMLGVALGVARRRRLR